MEKSPNSELVLTGLKDFQRRTADYVFQRMYLDSDYTRRFLIADEVGLGKTLVARGLIARTVEHLWERVPRIDIIYICSNVDIARQNINRLNITGNRDFTLPSRITLLPTTVQRLNQNHVNFISLTPSTSLDLKSSTGTWEERALLYHFLETAWGFRSKAALNVLQASMGRDRFRDWTARFRKWYQIDTDLEGSFVAALDRSIQNERGAGSLDLRTRFERLCDEFRHVRNERSLPEWVRWERNDLVGSLRTLLARTCISSLEPDLIILDEFQRFKHLLEPNNEAGHLAHDLFNFTEEDEKARVVLLSATPYKMYTTDEDRDEDHYKDFLRTVDFLLANGEQTAQFASVLTKFRHELLRLHFGSSEQAIRLRQEIEMILRRVMVRTERLALGEDRNGMMTNTSTTQPRLEVQDVTGYLDLQKVARHLGHDDTLEFWKSAPYLLNFMEDYKLKRALRNEAAVDLVPSGLSDALLTSSELLLDQEEITRYAAIDPRNSRMRSLLSDTVDADMWQILWLPPSLPYYQLAGPFASARGVSFTKRLVFSSWRVVPKVIAALASYEAERRMIHAFDTEVPENTIEARRRRRPLLRFARSEGRLSSMTTLGIIYPSFALAKLGDPLTLLANHTDNGEIPTANEVLTIIQGRIEDRLDKLQIRKSEEGQPDESWYWAAPILLDLQEDQPAASSWLESQSLPTEWSAGDENAHEDDELDEAAAQSAWADHVAMARAIAQQSLTLGPKPPDLVQVLAKMALSAPGIVALRAMSRVAGGPGSLRQSMHRICAGRIAWAFLTLFNLPESMALLRSDVWREAHPDNAPYWQRVLEYSIAGNIQAVLDEYVHLLRESLGFLDQPDEVVVHTVANAVRAAVALRTVSLSVDNIKVTEHTNRVSVAPFRMRSRFALRYGDSQSDDGKQGMRTDQVRAAFNSPFWPFILATTSVGQEGLDFHMYCHAVVHWNLPANPVDLEQREGRVHRYKGHAVRKNLAHVHGSVFQKGRDADDPWNDMFAAAVRESDTDLRPFWVYSIDNGARIERHVPVLPLSRDSQRLHELRRSLAIYRMVLGQSRQEDMLDYLMQNVPESEIQIVAEQLRMNLEPPRSIQARK